MSSPVIVEVDETIVDGTVGSGAELDGIDGDEKPAQAVEPNVIDLGLSQSVLSENAKSPDGASLIEPDPSPPAPPTDKQIEPLLAERASSPFTASPSGSPRQTLTMSGLANLADLSLHSPSSAIIGTPFATNMTRFEYPFPDTTSSPSSSSGSPPSGQGITASLTSPSFPSLIAGNSFPSTSTSPNASQISTPNLTLQFPPSSELPSYNTTHPKLKAPLNPPMPPGLAKKRPRWSLNILGRRKSSYGSQSSQSSEMSVDTTPTIESVISGHQVASPPGSPTLERDKHHR
ncbi:hypothetical protein B0H34DRAFT_801826 [Crassisporium funariophilum]|nr:hypothetical protein B0H34DRAFT_801826 [Crassisporium funariophilum]